MHKVHSPAILTNPEVEQIRKAMAVKAMQCAMAVRPILIEQQAIAAIDLYAAAALETRVDLKSCREDDAVDRILLAVDNERVLGNAIDASTVGIDEHDVLAIEGVKILIIESRALAKQTIPGLERFGGRLVLHHLTHPRADLIHLQEVGCLHPRLGLFRVLLLRVLHGKISVEIAEDVRPAVGDQILVLMPARQQGREILSPALLPTGLERFGPFGIGQAVAPIVD